MKRLSRLFGKHPSGEVDVSVEDTRPCPHCGKPVSRGATVCLHCEREITPLLSYADFARRFGSPHSGGPPHTEPDE